MIESCRRGLRAAFLWVILLGLWLVAFGGAATAAAFTPHRAVYDIDLAGKGHSGAVAQARGRLEFEWAEVCSGWTVSQRTRVEMVSADGRVVEFGWTLNALESKDGRHYRFFIRRLNADGPNEDQRGEAQLGGAGQSGLATYSEPAPREVVLPKGTLFPTAHSLLLIEAAERGDLPLWRDVFDGSGDEGLFGVNAALSHTFSADREPRFASPLLAGQKSWRIHLAYFGRDETVAEPEYEQTLRLFANGVIDELILDYGDFALRAELAELTPLPREGC